MLAYTVATCTSLSRACRKVNLKTCFVAWSPTPREQWRISARRCTDAHSRGCHIFRASTLKPYLECTLILCVEQRSQANGPDHPSTKSARHLEELVLHALERSERPAKRARRTLRLRDVDTRGDPERQEELRIDRLLSATTRAATRNEERRRHFGAVAALKQIRLRMQEHREEQQRSRYRCIVS